MTVKKAIEILDWWIGHIKQTLEQLKKEWKFDNDKPTEIAKMLIDSDQVAISNLKIIRLQLVPKCRPPDKTQDRLLDGQVYCMNCNLD